MFRRYTQGVADCGAPQIAGSFGAGTRFRAAGRSSITTASSLYRSAPSRRDRPQG